MGYIPQKESKVYRRYYGSKAIVEGTHEHDILITNRLLETVRRIGFVRLDGTVDGDIVLTHRPRSAVYGVMQMKGEDVLSHTTGFKRDVQGYLIDLRERKREQDKRKGRKNA